MTIRPNLSFFWVFAKTLITAPVSTSLCSNLRKLVIILFIFMITLQSATISLFKTITSHKSFLDAVNAVLFKFLKIQVNYFKYNLAIMTAQFTLSALTSSLII